MARRPLAPPTVSPGPARPSFRPRAAARRPAWGDGWPGSRSPPSIAARSAAPGPRRLSWPRPTARFAAEYAAWGLDPLAAAPPGGETGLAVMARLLPALRALVLRHAGQHVAVVAHKSANRLALCGLLGIDPRGYRDRLDQYPACLNVVDFDDRGGARLVLYNDVSHYRG